MRIAVLVPGLMGSALYYSSENGSRTYIWSEDFRENYRRLLSNPTELNWSGNVANAELLENVYITPVVHLPKRRLWRRLLDFLGHNHEFSKPGRVFKAAYDWRRSLLDSASDFMTSIDAHLAKTFPDTPSDTIRLTFFTHSLGGLLVRCAIWLHVLPTDRIDRIVHIGSPLEGAPDAFRAAYGDTGLPLLKELSNLIKGKNRHQFLNHLQECVRTFPSLYEVMPFPGNNFLHYSPGRSENPFDPRFPTFIPSNCVARAQRVHATMNQADRTLIGANTPVYTIFVESQSRPNTEIAYLVEAIAAPMTGYRVLEVLGRTQQGDGTVPAASARGNRASCKWKPILNVTHAAMCNEKKVVGLLPSIL
jgi:hypothetical protein